MTRDYPQKYAESADLLKTLAHPARLQIVDELRRGAACVCHLQNVLGRPQAYVSQQLRVLRNADLLETTRDGLNIYYSLADDGVDLLLNRLLGPPGPERDLPICPCLKCVNCDDGETCASPEI